MLKMLPEVSFCQQVAKDLEAFYKLASHRAQRQRDSSFAAVCGSVALTSAAAVPLDVGIFLVVSCRCLQSE